MFSIVLLEMFRALFRTSNEPAFPPCPESSQKININCSTRIAAICCSLCRIGVTAEQLYESVDTTKSTIQVFRPGDKQHSEYEYLGGSHVESTLYKQKYISSVKGDDPPKNIPKARQCLASVKA